MRIVISALHFEWDDMASCLGRAGGKFGLDGVELSWNRSFSRPHCTPDDMAWLREARGEHGLDLSAHIWENVPTLGPSVAMDTLRYWLDQCAETGVTTLVLHGGSWPIRDEGIGLVSEAVRGVAADFGAAGVTLCLENHYAFDYRDGHELLSEPWEFARVLGSEYPALAFCFDTGHGHMTRNWSELLREGAPWLRYVHLADNHGKHDDHCAYGQGTVPWNAMFDVLDEIDYDGVFCVEFPVRDELEPFRRCVAALRDRFEGC